jgi:hypothetical protein
MVKLIILEESGTFRCLESPSEKGEGESETETERPTGKKAYDTGGRIGVSWSQAKEHQGQLRTTSNWEEMRASFLEPSEGARPSQNLDF